MMFIVLAASESGSTEHTMQDAAEIRARTGSRWAKLTRNA
jgi:glucose-6-phosphate isomerase